MKNTDDLTTLIVFHYSVEQMSLNQCQYTVSLYQLVGLLQKSVYTFKKIKYFPNPAGQRGEKISRTNVLVDPYPYNGVFKSFKTWML